MRSTDVLIVGAGPVGLIMAQLGKRGVTCLQIEAEADLSDELGPLASIRKLYVACSH